LLTRNLCKNHFVIFEMELYKIRIW
jgi:hypothetical protein